MTSEFEDRYRKMSDDELLRIAASGDEMSPEAQTALQAELGKRHLLERVSALRVRAKLPETHTPKTAYPSEIEAEVPAESLEDGFYEYRDLVVIERFRDLVPAQIAQCALKSAGIQAFLRDENTVRIDWGYSNLIGGIRLVVEPHEADAALEILRSPTPASFDVGDGVPFTHVTCPRCNSVENGTSPLTFGQWECQECGHRWMHEEQ
jgi:Putative prokaryotic signal transducing protein